MADPDPSTCTKAFEMQIRNEMKAFEAERAKQDAKKSDP